jgi:hypothetical protein
MLFAQSESVLPQEILQSPRVARYFEGLLVPKELDKAQGPWLSEVFSQTPKVPTFVFEEPKQNWITNLEAADAKWIKQWTQVEWEVFKKSCESWDQFFAQKNLRLKEHFFLILEDGSILPLSLDQIVSSQKTDAGKSFSDFYTQLRSQF